MHTVSLPIVLLHFTAEQLDNPDLASVGNSLAGGPPPPPLDLPVAAINEVEAEDSLSLSQGHACT